MRPKADFRLPSQFAADVAESDINARRHCEFILGAAPVGSTPPDDYPAWLEDNAAHNAAELLRPHPSEALRAYPVSKAVNSQKNDGPECVEPAVRLRQKSPA